MNQSKKEEQNDTVINSENYLNDPIANQVVQKALNLFNEIIGENSAFTKEDKENLRKKMLWFLLEELPNFKGSLVKDPSQRLKNDQVLKKDMFKHFQTFSKIDPIKANYRANFYGIILYLIAYQNMEKGDVHDKVWLSKFGDILNKAKVEVEADTEEYNELLRFAEVIDYLTTLFTPKWQMFYFAGSLLEGPESEPHRQTGRPGMPKVNRDKIFTFVTKLSHKLRENKTKPKENIDESSIPNEHELFHLKSQGTEQMPIGVLTTAEEQALVYSISVEENNINLSNGTSNHSGSQWLKFDPTLCFFADDLGGFDLEGMFDFENCATVEDLDQRANEIWEIDNDSKKRKNKIPSQAKPTKKPKKHYSNN